MPGLLSFGLNILANIFYPKYCFGCQKSGSYLCKFCMSQIPSSGRRFCVVCNSPSLDGWTHDPCRTSTAPDRLLSAFSYQNSVVADMIITGKYYFVPEVFAILGAIATEHLFFDAMYFGKSEPSKRSNLNGFIITSIPLHSRRLKWRGFNQSEIIAKVMAQGLSLPYYPLLKRTKQTKTQKDLDAAERHINLQNAFSPVPISAFPEKVILIDDVATTGQTFLAAAAVLKQAGVKKVWCISIAKD